MRTKINIAGLICAVIFGVAVASGSAAAKKASSIKHFRFLLTLFLAFFAMQFFNESDAYAKGIGKLCSGHFDVITGKCLVCKKGYKVDILQKANSKKICLKVSKKKANYKYDTGSVAKACEKGTFANVGSTRCHKCAKGYHHDALKKVGKKGVCWKEFRKPVASATPVLELLAKQIEKKLSRCEASVKKLLPTLPIKKFSKTFYDGKLNIEVDGKFAKSYINGFACEFPAKFVGAIEKINKLKGVKFKDLVKNYNSKTCKKHKHGVRELCTLYLPIQKRVTECIKQVKPDKFVDLFKAVFKAGKMDTLTVNLNNMAHQAGVNSADAIMIRLTAGAYDASKKLDKKIKELLQKAGVPKGVIDTVSKAKDVVKYYQYANKALSACKV